MKFFKRAVIVVLILAVMGGGTFAGYYYLKPGASKAAASSIAETTEVTRQSIVTVVSAVGTVEMEEERTLMFRSTGIVDKVFVERGDMVEEGQLLSQLDTSDLELALLKSKLELRQAEINLRQAKEGPTAEEILAAQSSLDSAIANYNDVMAGPSEEDITIASRSLREAEITLQDAQEAYDKVAWHSDIATLSQSSDLQTATIAYEVALAEYEQAIQGPTDAEIKSAEASVVQAQTSLDELLEGPDQDEIDLAQINVELAQMSVEDAELDIEQSELYSPIDGVVVSVDTDEGELATDTQTAMTLADITSLHIEAGVDELDIGSVQVGQSVEITLDALEGETLKGHVDEIITLPSEESSGIVEYTVRIVLDTPSDKLRPGMSADAAIEVERVDDVLVVPSSYLKVNMATGDTYVLVLGTGNMVTSVAVEIGVTDGTVTEITSGLEEGDVVVLQSDGDEEVVTTESSDDSEVDPRQMHQIMDGGGGPPAGGPGR